jgi:DNA polymerase III delta subunit
MKYKEALSSLRHKKSNKFALVGNEPYLKEYFIKIVKEVYRDLSIVVLFPNDQSEVLSLLRSDSLFDDNFIVINHFDEMKIELFEESIKTYDGGLVISLSEKAKVKSRIITKILSDLTIVECTKLREYGMDYPIWIRNQIIEAGFKATDGVDELIFKRIGPNMYAIARELEKLFIYKDKEKFITLADVKKIVAVSVASTAFELFECLLRRNIGKALYCFSSYAQNHDNFFEIVAFMGNYLEKMYKIILLREREFEKDVIADIVGIPKFLLKTKYLPWALSFGKDNIAQKIDGICNLNIQLRLFKGDKKIIFEKFIYNFSK